MIILRKRVPGLSETMLESFLQKTRRAVGLRGTVNVLVTTSHQLRSLNARFRGKDTPTDVLSFPAISRLAQHFAGDIAISEDIAARNAKLLGHSTGDEVKILTLHGVLHLAGYDHERDNGTMARKEQRLRRSLGLPVALIERASTDGVAAGHSPVSGVTACPERSRRVRAHTGSATTKRRQR